MWRLTIEFNTDKTLGVGLEKSIRPYTETNTADIHSIYIRGAWWWSRFWLCVQRHQTHGNNSRLLLFFCVLLCLVVWKQLPAMVLVGMGLCKNPISWFFHKQIRYTDTNARHEVLELILNTNALGRMKYKVWWCARGARVFVLYPFHPIHPSIALFRFGLILPTVQYTPISYQLLLFIPLVNTKYKATGYGHMVVCWCAWDERLFGMWIISFLFSGFSFFYLVLNSW